MAQERNSSILQELKKRLGVFFGKEDMVHMIAADDLAEECPGSPRY